MISRNKQIVSNAFRSEFGANVDDEIARFHIRNDIYLMQ